MARWGWRLEGQAWRHGGWPRPGVAGTCSQTGCRQGRWRCSRSGHAGAWCATAATSSPRAWHSPSGTRCGHAAPRCTGTARGAPPVWTSRRPSRPPPRSGCRRCARPFPAALPASRRRRLARLGDAYPAIADERLGLAHAHIRRLPLARSRRRGNRSVIGAIIGQASAWSPGGVSAYTRPVGEAPGSSVRRAEAFAARPHELTSWVAGTRQQRVVRGHRAGWRGELRGRLAHRLHVGEGAVVLAEGGRGPDPSSPCGRRSGPSLRWPRPGWPRRPAGRPCRPWGGNHVDRHTLASAPVHVHGRGLARAHAPSAAGR